MKTCILHFQLLLILICNYMVIYSQEDNYDTYANNHLFLELGGNGYLYSINYERILDGNVSARGGFSIWPDYDLGFGDNNGFYYSVPVSASYLIGADRSKFEIGFGLTFFATQNASIFGYQFEDNSKLLLSGIIGYRGSGREGGFVFRIVFTPFIDTSSNFKIYPHGGVSFGYAFH